MRLHLFPVQAREAQQARSQIAQPGGLIFDHFRQLGLFRSAEAGSPQSSGGREDGGERRFDFMGQRIENRGAQHFRMRLRRCRGCRTEGTDSFQRRRGQRGQRGRGEIPIAQAFEADRAGNRASGPQAPHGDSEFRVNRVPAGDVALAGFRFQIAGGSPGLVALERVCFKKTNGRNVGRRQKRIQQGGPGGRLRRHCKQPLADLVKPFHVGTLELGFAGLRADFGLDPRDDERDDQQAA
jgi:hypothetical protein